MTTGLDGFRGWRPYQLVGIAQQSPAVAEVCYPFCRSTGGIGLYEPTLVQYSAVRGAFLEQENREPAENNV